MTKSGKQKPASKKAGVPQPANSTVDETSDSPVEEARNIPAEVRLRLVAATAGRCEFRGCNRFLYAHTVTHATGNFAENAHIVAFKEKGPRGDGPRPEDINAFENLMLLCQGCHHEIDNRKPLYTIEELRGWKRAHEERIQEVTAVGPEVETKVLQLRATIGGQQVDIPAPHVRAAIAPRYTADQRGHVIDLTSLSSEAPSFFELAREQLRRDVTSFLRSGLDSKRPAHYSVFALAPIPLLICFGRELGDKLSIDLYQRHRDDPENPWKWKTEGTPVEYELSKVRQGSDRLRVGLILSLSGKIAESSLPPEVDSTFSLYEMTLKGRESDRTFLRLREDLLGFRRAYQCALGEITRAHDTSTELFLFPAVPAPVAIACGQELLPKAHPSLVIYDNVNQQFRRTIVVNAKEQA